MKEILITNDDGFEALGINKLREALKDIAHITVVAPSMEKSACSHSLTLTKPLRFISIDDDFYKLDNATPADCIFLALHTLFPNKKPDLIVSGINHGANVAEDITYSGTCGGAMEAVLHGIPALAISQLYIGNSLEKYGFNLACEVTKEIIKQIFFKGFPLPPKKFLNLNIPAVSKKEYKGIKVVSAGEKFYTTDAQLNKNPRGLEYYWLGKMNINYDEAKNQNTDIKALTDGYASLTPITLNLTEYNELKSVEKWLN